MWFKKRVSVADLAYRARIECLRAADEELLQTLSGIRSDGVGHDMSVAIGDAVETWVLDISIVMGFVKRFVSAPPHLPLHDVAAECAAGCARAYETRPPLSLDIKQIQKYTAMATWTVVDHTVQNAEEFWVRLFRVGFPDASADEPGFRYFTALVAKQNGHLLPILDKIAEDSRPVV